MATSARRERRAPLRPSDPSHGPSVEWGWHGEFPRARRVAGLVSVIVLFGLMYPHDQPLSQMHLVWLTGVAAVLLIGVVLPAKRRR